MADDSFDRLLRQTLRRGTPADDCPDPSVLAACVDGMMPDHERRATLAHAASCPRCSAELGLIAGSAATTDSGSAAARRFRLHWRWAIPLATAVLVFVVWTETDREDRVPKLVREAPAPLRIGGSKTGDTAEPTAPDDRMDAATTDSVRSKEAQVEPKKRVPPSASAAREPAHPAPAAPDPPARQQERFAFEDGTVVSPSPVPPLPPREERGERESSDVRGADSAPAMRKTDTPGAAREEALPKENAATATAQSAAESSQPLERSPGVTGGRVGDAARWLEFSAPAETGVRVRVSPAGIERSTDRGLTWRLELEGSFSGVRAGSCPADEVCWLGGDGGRILRRAATGDWLEVSLPVRDTVAHIRAEDAERAVATLPDGRRFRTSDGGRTWSLLP